MTSTVTRSATRPATDADLVGAWRLVSFYDFEDGVRRPGPLGANPVGLLCYEGSGHVSVNMMAGPAPTGSDTAGRPVCSYMSYAGTWQRHGSVIVHRITIAAEPSWIGTEQPRELVYAGDRLVLRGNSLVGVPRRRVLEWERLG